jgi:hypothetical protein
MLKGIVCSTACLGIPFAIVGCSAEPGAVNGRPDGAAEVVLDASAAVGPHLSADGGIDTASIEAADGGIDVANGAGDGASGPFDAGDAAMPDGAAIEPVFPPGMPSPDYAFDGSISRVVLEKYLSRSISFTELLHDDLTQPVDARGVDPRDNMRLLISSKAKFVGRALMAFGGEQNIATHVQQAAPYAAALHLADPDMILEAAVFEIVTRNVEMISVPAAVLTEFAQPMTSRNFVYQDMLYANGNLVDHWGMGASVPDMSRLEARMWFYFLATTYIDTGIEAIHFGQIGLMDQNDPGHVGWLDMLGRVRAYAHQHARRHMVLCDAHTPTGGYVEGGKLLLDFHAFPLRIAEVSGQPYKGVLKVGYADSLYTRSKGGITPSGWSCDHLPYLVEFDNFGSHMPGMSSQAPFIWGWDEITWFALQAESDRNNWLRYAWQWLPTADPVAHLEMPGSRVLSPGPAGGPKWYWANTQSSACPNGFNTEATIRAIWGP